MSAFTLVRLWFDTSINICKNNYIFSVWTYFLYIFLYIEFSHDIILRKYIQIGDSQVLFLYHVFFLQHYKVSEPILSKTHSIPEITLC